MTQHAYNAQIAMAMLALVFMSSLAFVAGCAGDEESQDGGSKGYQVDRMAFPAINTVLVPSAKKDLFNSAKPNRDDADFLADFTTSITGLRAAVAARGVAQNSPEIGPTGVPFTPAVLAGALCPDVVNVDLGQTTGNSFTVTGSVPNETLGTSLKLNGRNLTDDVIDAALILILNNSAATDGIGAHTYQAAFPYLSAP
jgi:hypothetical protein